MKTIDEIYGDMLDVFALETGYDMEASADLAVRLKAAASEIFSLYVYADWVGRMNFPQTAEGQYLDYHAQVRGVTRRASAKASGQIRFYIDRALGYNLTIPQGTTCQTAGLVAFVTTQAGTITAGSLYVDVTAEAAAAGESGNVGAGTVVSMPLPPVGIGGCTNNLAFAGGVDGESDQALRLRVLDTYKRLPNGANAAYYENLALEDSGVLAVNVIPRWDGVGTVGVVVTPVAGTDSQTLLSRLQARLDSMREIAVDVTVMTPEEITVPVIVSVSPAGGYDYCDTEAAVRAAFTNYFDGRLLARPLLLRDLYSLLGNLETVENYKVLQPQGDISIDGDQMAVLGSVTISRMGV